MVCIEQIKRVSLHDFNIMENKAQLTDLYKALTGEVPVNCMPITGSGSNRQYFRLTGPAGKTWIGVVGTSKEENHAFVYLSRHFAAKGLPVPEVTGVSPDGLVYLQTDLGGTSLFDAIRNGREAGGNYSEKERELLRRTIARLPELQIRGAEGLDFSQCYPQEEMDGRCVMFDLNYFKYCFLKATGIDFHEVKLETDFLQMAEDLTTDEHKAFLYRDFQARNVMLDAEGEPWFIDFQGGRRGPLHYDVASFLWQASARYPDTLREELIGVYLDSLRKFVTVDEKEFRTRLRSFVLFRLLQVLGDYGFRGYFERKQHFLDSIPPALESLRQMLADGACPYPYLREILGKVVENFPSNEGNRKDEPDAPENIEKIVAQRFPNCCATIPQLLRNNSETVAQQKKIGAQQENHPTASLRVRIFSFSYKKGIPEDESGNGGGYVFDCRSTHNPGRYEPYKQLTGLDAAVIRFLEDDGEILTFLESVYRLADAHVERYMQRGFTDLMFSFGCTGGQHRSVYSAQHLAEHLNQKYGIEVELCHREQGIRQHFPA